MESGSLRYLQCRFWIEFNEGKVTEVGLEEILSQFSVFSMDSFQLWNLALAFYVFCLWGTQTALNRFTKYLLALLLQD